jgi:spermidine/putrescine transport system ATP-binding protein
MTTTTTTAAPAVDLAGVEKRFGDFVAVRHLDLQIQPGEFFSIIGPSGCGKTTTLRMVAGFEDPTAGRVSVGGRDMTGVRPYRRPVNTVFQSYALFPHLDVFENVAFGLREARVGKAEVRERVAEAIRLVQLEGREGSRPRKLSGGQQQRVALARALVNRPEVLLLDEPLGALDLKLRTEMQNELKDLQRGVGVTFCYVTHDQGEAFSMSDRVAVMNLGLLEQVGTPEDVYHRPASLFVADFVGKANRFHGRVESGGPGTYTVAIEGIGQRRVPGPDGLAPGAEVAVVVRPENLRLAPAQDGDGVAASVVDAAFLGAVRTVRLQSSRLGELTAAAGGAAGAPVPGSTVSLTWDADHAWLVPTAETPRIAAT